MGGASSSDLCGASSSDLCGASSSDVRSSRASRSPCPSSSDIRRASHVRATNVFIAHCKLNGHASSSDVHAANLHATNVLIAFNAFHGRLPDGNSDYPHRDDANH